MTTHNPQKKAIGTFLFRLFIMATLAALSVAAITLVRFQQFQDTALNLPDDGMIYNMPTGASLNQLAYDLETRGMIQYPRFLILLGRQMDAATRLQAGEYDLAQGVTTT